MPMLSLMTWTSTSSPRRKISWIGGLTRPRPRAGTAWAARPGVAATRAGLGRAAQAHLALELGDFLDLAADLLFELGSISSSAGEGRSRAAGSRASNSSSSSLGRRGRGAVPGSNSSSSCKGSRSGVRSRPNDQGESTSGGKSSKPGADLRPATLTQARGRARAFAIAAPAAAPAAAWIVSGIDGRAT